MRCSLFCLAILLMGAVEPKTLSSLRTYYAEAQSKEASANALLKLTNQSNEPLMIAYNGAAYAFLANHYFNPYSKLSALTTGLDQINKAVNSANTDIEIRFIRFSIEENIPGFVPCTKHLATDKAFLLKNLSKQHSYFSTMKAYLLASAQLSAQEKELIKAL
jgi:hypothetical protein